MNNSFPFGALKAYQLWADCWSRSGWRVQEHVLTGQSRVIDAVGKIRLSADLADCLRMAQAAAPAPKLNHAVMLLHGMGRTARSFDRLAAELAAGEYAVTNCTYASLSASPEQHLERLRRIAIALAEDGATKISFVGHSYGGMLVRQLLAGSLPVSVGRVLMLGTPNQGSRFGQRLSLMGIYRIIFGASGQAVLPVAAANLPVPAGDIAVIAGGNGRGGYNPFLPGDNDGIVMVEEARLPGAQFRIMPCLHTFLPSQPAIRRAAVAFIETGKLL